MTKKVIWERIKLFFKNNWLKVVIAVLVFAALTTFLIPRFSKINTKIIDTVNKAQDKIQDNKIEQIKSEIKFEITKNIIEEKKQEKLKELDKIINNKKISPSERNERLNDFHASIKRFK